MVAAAAMMVTMAAAVGSSKKGGWVGICVAVGGSECVTSLYMLPFA
jgi:hypothetical protein